ncbi:MAG TPA: class I SAM-dependent methyltransferase [Candidatus Angelobacter sp.]|nr:class I SAM-dependent methyltransferase [Candidatus Angelobacter sp.]
MDTVLVMKIVKMVLVLGAAVYIVSQVRKPDRFAGRLFAMLMNQSHSKLTDWGLMHIRVGEDFTILDVGCGGGRTIGKLAAIASNGKVHGVDYAAGSVATSCSRNKEFIRAGQVEIQQASVSKLPFAADTFDLVTAIETQYYWPDLPSDMREVLRVLKSGGMLAIIAETYKGGSRDVVLGTAMKLFGSPSLGVKEHKELFARAGYINVEVFEEQKKGWICITGTKPPTVV